ncbi:MAG TPA: peptidoglycan editing factor PgeF [Segeticoccus sp.]|uniref:peptidoglycan editing factor PgeF n=1 Tax=Segeticoccus sp. TaxID=2706531 RepID=UPI002D809351|nr:peptidoglycan editing factor PgeF [Segeticoccus sp.]HET8601877.1 peptidoglycan editing factor PgeF [Segeticoccus sp.]
MFWWRERLVEPPGSRLEWGFTDRDGGLSTGPCQGLNLGRHVGDDPETVTANRALLAQELGLTPDRLVFMHQVHGADVSVVDGPGTGEAPRADALVTRHPGLALVVLVADCTPVLLADRRRGVVGAVHAGRPGMMARVATAAVEAMRDLGARDLEAVVGPSVCPRCYEVPAELRDAAARVTPVAASVSREGTPAIDVAGAVVEQLREAGVRLRWVPGCTRESDALYSYRRDHRTGRFCGVVHLLDATPGDTR